MNINRAMMYMNREMKNIDKAMVDKKRAMMVMDNNVVN